MLPWILGHGHGEEETQEIASFQRTSNRPLSHKPSGGTYFSEDLPWPSPKRPVSWCWKLEPILSREDAALLQPSGQNCQGIPLAPLRTLTFRSDAITDSTRNLPKE